MQKTAEPFVATAVSADGIIEAMELKPEAARKMPFLLSVQFYPERLTPRYAAREGFLWSLNAFALFAFEFAQTCKKPRPAEKFPLTTRRCSFLQKEPACIKQAGP